MELKAKTEHLIEQIELLKKTPITLRMEHARKCMNKAGSILRDQADIIEKHHQAILELNDRLNCLEVQTNGE